MRQTSTEFRLFCIEKWYEHKDEILAWTGHALTEYNDKYYFRQHRWMLRRMFREYQIEQFRINNERKIEKEIKRGFKKGNI